MSTKKPREWWLVLGPGGRWASAYISPELALAGSVGFVRARAALVHVREALPKKRAKKSIPKVLVRRPWLSRPGEWEAALRIDHQTFAMQSNRGATKKNAQWSVKMLRIALKRVTG